MSALPGNTSVPAPAAVSSNDAEAADGDTPMNIVQTLTVAGGPAGPEEELLEDEPLEPDDPLLDTGDLEPPEIEEKGEDWLGDRIVR